MDEVALSLKNLKKDYGKVKALKGINITVNKGDFYAFLGPNGAGKTTAISIISGLCNKTSGAAKVFGYDVEDDYMMTRRLIGLVPQEVNIDGFLQVGKILEFVGGYFGLTSDVAKARAEELMKKLDLWEKRDTKAIALSGGMKRRLIIARALMHSPKLLILDEPTAGVDVELRRSTWDFIRQLHRDGTTIILTTHYIEEAEELCNRIAVIDKGNIIREASKEEFMALAERSVLDLTLEKAIKRAPATLKVFGPELMQRGKMLRVSAQNKDLPKLMKALGAAKLPIVNVTTRNNRLEDVFLEMVKK